MRSEAARLLRVGTISGGATEILADVSYLGGRKSVLLSVDYAMERPGGGLTGAFPTRPFLVGVRQPEFPYTIVAGSTIEIFGGRRVGQQRRRDIRLNEDTQHEQTRDRRGRSAPPCIDFTPEASSH
jgi:hypothetical protein